MSGRRNTQQTGLKPDFRNASRGESCFRSFRWKGFSYDDSFFIDEPPGLLYNNSEFGRNGG